MIAALMMAQALMTGAVAASGPVSEADAIAAHSDLVRRDGHKLIVTYAGHAVIQMVDGESGCDSYHFVDALPLYDARTHRVQPVAELTCNAADKHVLLWPDADVQPVGAHAVASSDGHYVFIDQMPDRPGAGIFNWAAGYMAGTFDMPCTNARAEGIDGFVADCAKHKDVHVARLVNGSGLWTMTVGQDVLAKSNLAVISNGGDPFVMAQNEAAAIAAHPGLVRRDGPDLVILDNGKDARRMGDIASGCHYWFHDAVSLYDPNLKAMAPVARVACQRGEFEMALLAPSYADPLPAPQGLAVSPDGKIVLLTYGSTDIVDWVSRQVLFHLPTPCRDLKAVGDRHFTCVVEDAQPYTADFAPDASGTWQMTKAGA